MKGEFDKKHEELIFREMESWKLKAHIRYVKKEHGKSKNLWKIV